MDPRRFEEEETFVKLPPLRKKVIKIPNSVCRRRKDILSILEEGPLKLPALEARKEERRQVEEKQLRNTLNTSTINKAQNPSKRVCKSRQTILDAGPQSRQENTKRDKPQGFGCYINKDWLQLSLENLQRKNSNESRINVLEWLCERLITVKRYVFRPAGREDFGSWLLKTWVEFQREHPETFEGDVDQWVQITLRNIVFEGPSTSFITTQEWIESSIRGIKNLPKCEPKSQRVVRNRWVQK